MNSLAPGHSLLLPSVAIGLTRVNPPGQYELSYRGGAFLATLDRLLIRLPRQTIPGPDGGSDLMPFARFNVEDSGNDWTLALLHAWAAVTGVLGFYQERIINEGYLRTATERLSIVQLARTVGYELQPGLAASTMLAFTVAQGLGEPPQSVFIPKGTAVQSVPPPKSGLHQGTPASSLPQIFETSDDLVARSDWNLLRPAAKGELTGKQCVLPSTNSLRLLGHRTDLRGGERLLFVGQDPDHPERKLWRMAEVVSTAADIAKGFTAVAWKNAPGMPANPLPYQPDSGTVGGSGQPALPQAIAAPQIFVLRQKARLFTYTATGVYRNWPPPASGGAISGSASEQAPAGAAGAMPSPGNAVAWWPAGIGLPHEPVESIVSTRSGHLLAVTKKDIHRSSDGGATWQPAGAGLQAWHATALTLGDDGTLYAGTDKGEVYLSQDEGGTWRQAAGDPIHLPVRGLRKLVPAILQSSGHLPGVVISSLAAYRDGSTEVLAAGTDSGVFLSMDRGRSWKAANLVLPDVDRKTGLTKVGVKALSSVQDGKRRRLYAGTDAGVFPIRPTPNAGPIILAGFVLALLFRLFSGAEGGFTRQVYAAGVAFLQSVAKMAIAFFKSLAQAIGAFQLPRIGNPIATPAGKLIDNLDKAISTLTKRIPATIPVAGSKAAKSLPKPIPAILDFAHQYPILWLLVDAALIAAAIGVVIAAWWLIWRFLNNRPSRRIAGTPPLAAKLPSIPGKLPSGKDLVKLLRPKNPPVAVRDLQAGATGLYAGTVQGVYHVAGPGPRPGDKWLRRLSSRVVQLAFPGLLSGWTPLKSSTGAQPDIQTLALPDGKTLLAATKAGEIYRYRYVDNAWQPEPKDSRPLALTGIAGTVASAGGLYLAGTPSVAKVDSQWSPWQVQACAIDLDAVQDGIAPGSWLILESAEGAQNDQQAPLPRLYKVIQVARSDSNDAARPGQLLRVTVDRDDALTQYDRTRAQALFQSEPLAIFDDEPVQGNVLTLNRVVPGLQPGQQVIVSGKRMRARLVAPPGATVTLTAMNGLQTASVQAGESLILLEPPRSDTAPSSHHFNQEESVETWHLLNRDGIAGQVQIEASPNGIPVQFVIEPPQEEDQEVNELAVIQGVSAGADQTTLTLLKPLANILERTTVAMCANVVRATHGSTVPAEVLGNSDGSQANQRFALRQAPLTYVSSATPEGRQSTLAITVAGARWRQAPFLYGRPRDERAYVVRHDENGHAIITFGDGRAGARLPSTREEVKATYRIGIGEPGNVSAGSLTQLRSAPPGLAEVTNPISASGGVDPEANDSIRANAPLALRAMHRIVSLSDYEDFVRSFAGVGRVQAQLFPTGRGGLLYLTVADSDGNPISQESALYTNLVAAVERARVAPTPMLQITSYQPVFFDVALTLIVDPDARARQPIIEQQARQALTSAFAFQRREFAQDVSASEIINLVQPITGVVGVKVTKLVYHGDSPAQTSPVTLAAHPAQWLQGQALPAQMLLLNSQSPDGLTIEVEFAHD